MPLSHPHSPRWVCRKLQLANPPRLSSPRPARGFTLTEVLVVIGIIAVLAAVLVPTVMSTLRTARSAAVKAEIDLLNMAMVAYQAEYGVYPPCFDRFFAEQPASYKANGEAAMHIKRLFPRCTNPANQLNAFDPLLPLVPSNALVAWLAGFTQDSRSPLQPPNNRNKLFDFDRARITGAGGYHPSRKPNSAYVYIDAAHYGPPANPTTYTDLTTGVQYKAEVDPIDSINKTFFNPDTFQILCAGDDGEWGTEDDLSNFWPATREEYEESRNK